MYLGRNCGAVWAVQSHDRARKALHRMQAHGWLIEDNGAEVAGKPRKEAWQIVRSAVS